MPTAKEIFVRLVDEKHIDGEEAYVLLNAILQSEMIEAWKVLDDSKKSIGDNYNLHGISTVTSNPTWYYGSAGTTNADISTAIANVNC